MESMAERVSWIRDLVKAEEQMEESGIVDLAAGHTGERLMVIETLNFLNQIKQECIDASSAFNELKASALGRIKIYGIANTQADFMLFRNGYKMIFSMKAPGAIAIRFNFIGSTSMNPTSMAPTAQPTTQMEEHVIEAKIGPFGEMTWMFQGQPVQLLNIVKHHMTLFVKESTR